MRFTIRVRNDKDGREWEEQYNKNEVRDQASAEKKGRQLVQYFNDTLRPHESPRTFLSATIGEGNALLAHDWYKTNLTTIVERGRVYDTAECSRCGITAKRFGLGDPLRDSQYRAKAFASCDTAQALLAKREAKRKGEKAAAR